MTGSESVDDCLSFFALLAAFYQSSQTLQQSPVLLKIDDQISQYTTELLNLAKNNGVVLLTVPPHTTQKLQPLKTIVMGGGSPTTNRKSQVSWLSLNVELYHCITLQRSADDALKEIVHPNPFPKGSTRKINGKKRQRSLKCSLTPL